MKVLLLGDYSNVHATLAEGLRALGHSVCVASDGDGWKDYPRDVDMKRYGTIGDHTLRQRMLDVAYWLRLKWLFATKFRGFDVVQIINPVFLPLRAERIMPFYRQLRQNNGKVFMAAYGMDRYWVRAGLDCATFRYSDFNFGTTVRTDIEANAAFVRDWLEGPKGELNEQIVSDCDGIPAGLYEYWASYSRYLPEPCRQKLRYIPFPIVVEPCDITLHSTKTRFFIGIQQSRSSYKGTDVMLRALRHVEERFPEEVEVIKAENVPFVAYKQMLATSDVILDQLYSYTPAMNALQAMSQGLIVVGGAEPEYYDLQEKSVLDGVHAEGQPLRPIFNVEPNEESVYDVLCQLVERRADILRLKLESRAFVERYHDHIGVAKQYIDFWTASSR